jgi:DNA-binding MarR family transcriptional regulator
MPLVHLLRAVAMDFDLRASEFAASHGLHPTDLRALIALLDGERAGEAMTPGRLGSRLHLNSPAVTALLDRLEGTGFARRERDPADRRRVLLVASDEAKALGWSFFGPLIARVLSAMKEFDDAELDSYERVLRRVGDAVAGVGAETGAGAGD